MLNKVYDIECETIIAPYTCSIRDDVIDDSFVKAIIYNIVMILFDSPTILKMIALTKLSSTTSSTKLSFVTML